MGRYVITLCFRILRLLGSEEINIRKLTELCRSNAFWTGVAVKVLEEAELAKVHVLGKYKVDFLTSKGVEISRKLAEFSEHVVELLSSRIVIEILKVLANVGEINVTALKRKVLNSDFPSKQKLIDHYLELLKNASVVQIKTYVGGKFKLVSLTETGRKVLEILPLVESLIDTFSRIMASMESER